MARHLDHARFLRIVHGEDRSTAGALARTGLALAAGAYRAAASLRNRLFDTHLRKAARLGRPVISIGNLTTGGTGKTPMVIETVRRLRELGHRPAVLLRGYGDDETCELAAAVGEGVPVEANPNRRAQAADLLARRPELTVFVLDDGFQHRQVHRDLDLVLIDASAPFGGDRLLPRGLLREPTSNLRRADAVIVTRSDHLDPAALARLDAQIASLTDRAPLAHVTAVWRGWRGWRAEADTRPIDALREARVLAACGIGNPGAFERQLREHVGEVVDVRVCNDHHAWTRDEIAALLDRAREQRADAVVTTEKDWVKWQPMMPQHQADARVPVYRPVLATSFLDGEAAFATLLSDAMREAADVD